jgi:hypothetical protein
VQGKPYVDLLALQVECHLDSAFGLHGVHVD